MTKRELIKRYLDSIGKVRVSGDTTEPLLPFLLGDAIYSIYAKDIAPLPLVREQKKLRNCGAAAKRRSSGGAVKG